MSVFTYENTPGMDQPARSEPREQQAPERPRDELGRALFDYNNSQTAGKAGQCTIKYLDGRQIELPYPDISAAIAAGAPLDLKNSILDGEEISLGYGVHRALDLSGASLKGTTLHAPAQSSFAGSRFDGADARDCEIIGNFADTSWEGAKMGTKTRLDANLSGSTGLDTVAELGDAEIAPSTRFDRSGVDLRALGLLDETPANTPPHELFDAGEEPEEEEPPFWAEEENGSSDVPAE